MIGATLAGLGKTWNASAGGAGLSAANIEGAAAEIRRTRIANHTIGLIEKFRVSME
jgi:hypothetical protein